ncbi:MAG: hypothetical protein ACI379_02810 [Nocardioides sp.]|uniref:hypothetical protein n=1 Tax=Nocardioides sp. TaxID=35761 RepID=UPI003F071A48
MENYTMNPTAITPISGITMPGSACANFERAQVITGDQWALTAAVAAGAAPVDAHAVVLIDRAKRAPEGVPDLRLLAS